MIVRYTKENICIVDGEDMAKLFAMVYANNDYSDENAWYEIEPYAVL